jgi:hypothetical protein
MLLCVSIVIIWGTYDVNVEVCNKPLLRPLLIQIHTLFIRRHHTKQGESNKAMVTDLGHDESEKITVDDLRFVMSFIGK